MPIELPLNQPNPLKKDKEKGWQQQFSGGYPPPEIVGDPERCRPQAEHCTLSCIKREITRKLHMVGEAQMSQCVCGRVYLSVCVFVCVM